MTPDGKPQKKSARTGAPRFTRAKTWIARIFLVLGVLAICAATVFGYLQKNIFESANFADHAQTALKSPAVRTWVSRELTDQLINEVVPDAVAVGPLIETVSEAVIQSDAFGRTFRSSVLQMHSAVVAGDTSGAVLTVANVGVLVRGLVERLSPSLAGQIPKGFDAALGGLANVRAVDGIVEASRASKRGALISLIAGILLLAAALVLAPQRRRMLRAVGVGLVVGGVGLIVAWLSLRSVVVMSVAGGHQLQADATRELYGAFLDGLVIASIGLAALGAVIAASADGLLTGMDLDRRLTQLLEKVGRPPEKTALRVVWSIALFLIGVTIVTNTAATARVIITTLGVLIAARGFQTLVLMVAPPDPETIARDEKPQLTKAERRHRRRRHLAFGGALVAAIALAIGVDARYGHGLETLGIVPSTTQCNGSDSLCAKPVNEVALATTHNSMANTAVEGFLFPMQEASIGAQLADGIRGLQIDVYYGYPGTRVYTDADISSPKARKTMEEEFGKEFVESADRVRRSLSRPSGVAPELYLCHGFCELGALPLKDAFDDVRKFLDDNPREFMAIVFEDYVPWQGLAKAIEQAGLDRFAYRGPWEAPLPTLKEAIDSNKRLLLLTENELPDVPWMHNAYEIFEETPYFFPTISKLAAPSSCDENRGGTGKPLFMINHWIDTAPNPRPSIARRVNAFSFLWKRVERCQRVRKHFPNMVAVDFYREGDLFRVVDDLNGIR